MRFTDSRTVRQVVPFALGCGIVVVLALTSTRTATANDDERARQCSNRTLRGAYGILVSGIRGAGPGVTEMIVATALRTYDGEGNFTHLDSAHGQITGVARDREAFGTYDVNADCTGSATMHVPGVPFPIETSFVVVENGRQVKEAVMSPAPNLVTAVGHRVK